MFSVFSKSDPQAKKWLATNCPAIGTCSDQPVPLFFTNVHKGYSMTHHTHKLFAYKGFIYCNKCGCRAGCHVLKGLAHPCEPPTSYGAASLNALREGRLPPRLSHWPSDPPPKSFKNSASVVDQDPIAKRVKVMRPTTVPLGSAFAMSLTSPRSEITHPPQVFQHDLQDLLELHDSGHVVVWPEGYNEPLAWPFVFFSYWCII